jgi:predicted lysophospholipase L1 biosynthesis ABC-type transport system permease subunit
VTGSGAAIESPEQAGASPATRAIFAAGLLCGVMDISAAFLTWLPKGVRPLRLLQGIASGLLGPSSFQHGWTTGALGLAFHFLIAFTAAAVFYAASRKLPALLEHPWLAGVGYALVVYGFMYWVVMPLSRLHRSPVTLTYSVTAIVTHILCVGLPISLMVHRLSRR